MWKIENLVPTLIIILLVFFVFVGFGYVMSLLILSKPMSGEYLIFSYFFIGIFFGGLMTMFCSLLELIDCLMTINIR